MQKKQDIEEILESLLEYGYYDPEERYANTNTTLLESLQDVEQTEYRGAFSFCLKHSPQQIAFLEMDSNVSFIKLSTYLNDFTESFLFKQAFVTDFLRKYNCVSIYIDSCCDFRFEQLLFVPLNKEQFLAALEFYDLMLTKFHTEYRRTSRELAMEQE